MSKSSKQVSEIDRLIDLASDSKPDRQVVVEDRAGENRSLSLEIQKDPGNSMWRTLTQLRVLLPYLAKLLPLVERGLLGTNITGHAAPPIDTSHLDRGIAGVGEAQRDVNTAVKAQTGEIKFLQEQVAWLSKSIEKDILLHEELTANLASAQKLVKSWALVIVALLVALIGLAGFAVFAHTSR